MVRTGRRIPAEYKDGMWRTREKFGKQREEKRIVAIPTEQPGSA
ncbi:hypothetical protein AB0O82_25720 [Kitasatospora sp. NPDC088264]